MCAGLREATRNKKEGEEINKASKMEARWKQEESHKQARSKMEARMEARSKIEATSNKKKATSTCITSLLQACEKPSL